MRQAEAMKPCVTYAHSDVYRPGDSHDLWIFDIDASEWTSLSTALGTPPSARDSHGFTSAGGKLYVFGGWDNYGACSGIDSNENGVLRL